jgi:hypothetical protein
MWLQLKNKYSLIDFGLILDLQLACSKQMERKCFTFNLILQIVQIFPRQFFDINVGQ